MPLNEYEMVAAAALVVGYCAFQYRVIKWVRPLRLELASEGEALLCDSRLQEHERDIVEFMLDNAFNPLVSVIAAVIGPVMALGFALRLVRPPEFDSREQEVRLRYAYVDSLFTKSVIAANPIGGVLMAASFLLMGGIAFLSGLSWNAVDQIKETTMRIADISAHPHFRHS